MPSLLNVPINIDKYHDDVIVKKDILEYESEILTAMRDKGLESVPLTILYDNKIHRFGKDGDFWYSAKIIGDIPIAYFGDWRDKATWGSYIASIYQKLDDKKRAEINEAIKIQRLAAEQEEKKVQSEAARTAVSIWENASPADHRTNVYLDAKQLHDAHGARIDSRGVLTLPIYGPDGKLMSLQYILGPGKGNKKYLTGGKTAGGYWWIGNPQAQSVYLCEGFATAGTINEITHKTVFISYSAYQLVPVAKMLAERGQSVTVIADNDSESKVGQTEGDKAAHICGGKLWVIPNNGDPKVTDANDYQNKYGNLKDIIPSLENNIGNNSIKLIWAQDLIGKPSPIRWLVKGWIPQKSVGMIYGPPGGGKTNFIMDIACTLTTASMDKENPTTWADDRRCKRSKVIYLCGEGIDGLRGRLNAWMVAHDTVNIGYFGIVEKPVDLDIAGGPEMAIAAIREQIHDDEIDMLIIDTVNRYMSGDENSAQDARAFLNQTEKFREAFGCTIVYIHHSGKNDADIENPRGSSAFPGAMDFIIAVYKDKEQNIRVAKPMKMKDGELRQPLYGDIIGIPLGEGWNDPDDIEPYTAPIWKYIPAAELIMEGQRETNNYDSEIIDAFAYGGIWNDRDRTIYIAKEKWREYLKDFKGMSSSGASNYLKGGIVGHAVKNGRLRQDSSGWTMLDRWMIEQVQSSKEAQ